MTGFQLNWFLKDASGNRVTETLPGKDTPSKWKPMNGHPSFVQDILQKLVVLASIARKQNMTTHQIINKVIQEKSRLIKIKFLHYRTMCAGSQLLKVHYPAVFDQLNLGLTGQSPPVIRKEDITTGFMLTSAMVYCPKPVFTIYDFLRRLVTSETPRTIIQATVNTIQSEIIKEPDNQQRFYKFYTVLDKIFNFQLGKILLAISSLSQLEDMVTKDLPYITKYLEEIEKCLAGKSCQGVSELVQSLGKLNIPWFINKYTCLRCK